MESIASRLMKIIRIQLSNQKQINCLLAAIISQYCLAALRFKNTTPSTTITSISVIHRSQ